MRREDPEKSGWLALVGGSVYPAFMQYFRAGLFVLFGVGCGGVTQEQPRVASPQAAELSTEDIDAAMNLPRASTGAAPSSRTLQEPSAPLARTVRIAEPQQPRRPRSGRRIDVDLHRASLESALQLLADEAHLNLVLGDGISGEVSLSLRRVDPAEALAALAESRGLSFSRQGSITIVKKQ